MIRNITLDDARAVGDIYNHYIENSIATFELEKIPVDEIIKRIKRVILKYPWIVYEENNQILGYAYADEWKVRKAYQHTVESTVYLRDETLGRGIGTKLYSHLIELLKSQDIHAVIGGISLPNEASIALHEKLGFEKIGQFREVGYKFDRWIDVGYWELILK